MYIYTPLLHSSEADAPPAAAGRRGKLGPFLPPEAPPGDYEWHSKSLDTHARMAIVIHSMDYDYL